MTPDFNSHLAELDELEKKVTPGPWTQDSVSEVSSVDGDVCWQMSMLNNDINAQFIAASRNLVREMIERIRLLEAITHNPTAFPRAWDYAAHLEKENARLRELLGKALQELRYKHVTTNSGYAELIKEIDDSKLLENQK